MKKIYIKPTTQEVDVKIENIMGTTSNMRVGEDWTSGSAASRDGGMDWEEDDY